MQRSRHHHGVSARNGTQSTLKTRPNADGLRLRIVAQLPPARRSESTTSQSLLQLRIRKALPYVVGLFVLSMLIALLAPR